MKPEPLAVSPQQAASMIGCGKTQFYKLINAGKIVAKKQGRSTIIPVASLQSYLADLPNRAPTPSS